MGFKIGTSAPDGAVLDHDGDISLDGVGYIPTRFGREDVSEETKTLQQVFLDNGWVDEYDMPAEPVEPAAPNAAIRALLAHHGIYARRQAGRPVGDMLTFWESNGVFTPAVIATLRQAWTEQLSPSGSVNAA